MNRSLRLASLGCATAVLIAAPWAGTLPATAQTPSVTETVRSFSELTQKTYTFMEAFRTGNARVVLPLLEPQLAKAVNVQTLSGRLREDLTKISQLKGFTISSIDQGPGLDTVTVLLQTPTGQTTLRLLFNQSFQIVGYDIPDQTESPEQVARDFVQALAEQHALEARSLLSPFLKTEVFPQQIEQRWKTLQQRTGTFERIVAVRSAGEENGITLMLVEAKFKQATDSIFISLDSDNRITNVDFPENPRTN